MIKMIWSQVKQLVASSNITFESEDIKLLCEQKFGEMREREWHPMCDHVKRIGKQNFELEGIIDLEVDRVIISLGGNASQRSSNSLLRNLRTM
jgi:hypothetical protein